MFDQNKFANILKKINDNYSTMTDFGKNASFDRTYISKYINKKLKNPPTPKILEKIAKASKGITTYSELMDICGYLDVPSRKSIKKRIFDTRKSELIDHNFSNNEIKLIEDYISCDSSDSNYTEKFNRFENYLYSLDENKQNFLLEFCPQIILNASQELVNFSDAIDSVLDKSNNMVANSFEYDYLGNSVFPIPILGTVKAGYDYLAQENWIGTVDVETSLVGNGEDYFALKIHGDSMSPVLVEDDIVIIKKQNDFESGDIVVAIINGNEATIKKGKKSDSSILLQPLNPSYEPLIFTNSEMKTIPVEIIGIVKQLKREF